LFLALFLKKKSLNPFLARLSLIFSQPYLKSITELPPYISTTIAENPYPSMDTPIDFS
jgi:hypothetical protein